MSRKIKNQAKSASDVQVFSSLVQMKFKPDNQQGTIALNQSKEKRLNNKEYVEMYDPTIMTLQTGRSIEDLQSRRIRFVANLSADHFIIGNQNQLDLISFGAIAHNFVDTEYFWSLHNKVPIESVTVDPKKSLLLILSQNTIFFYRYNVKHKELPVQLAKIAVKEGVRFIRFLKDILLGVFYNSNFEIYNIQNLGLIKKKLDKSYQVGNEKKLLTIPPSIDNIINVFFEESKQKKKQSFVLWCLQINFEDEKIKTRQLYRVYDIMNYTKDKLSIQNYTKDIIFMNLNRQLMAIKNGYLIDTVNLSVNQEGQLLKYMHPDIILHITKKQVQVYNFSINMAVKPQKIVLRSVDSIQIGSIPKNAFCISVLRTFNNNFAIFFQDSEKKKVQTNGQITYYFQVSQTTTIKTKINNIFQTISEKIANPEVIQEKYNMAKKMGLTEKQIFLQIWNRSSKCSLQDYQYILSTKDYKTIKFQIEKKLKKQSMALREILRIQEGCHDINKQKIQSSSCSEENLQDFVTSHFLMKKLKLFKDIHVLDRLSSIVQSDEQGNSEIKQFKIDIQQYYSFKNADIKTLLIEQINDMLFKRQNNAKIIRIIIKQFRFCYRVIYKQILEELILASKDELKNLFDQIPQLLPYFHTDLNQDQLAQGLYNGIWGAIQPFEWENSLYPEAIQNIQNRGVLKDFINSVWFKRYWLTAHGMISKSKQEIDAINTFNNSDKIFYYFISKLYEHTKNNKPFYYETMDILSEKYLLFPAHLKGKTLLYENLFIYYFNEEVNTPGRLTFAQFLEWDDQSLFKYFFDHEKVKKNSLLKEVKSIYEQSDSNGSHLFNIGLFSYFYSDKSEISDLKFILNRINNQKAQFHQKNFGIYEVLIKSIQLKLKLGGKNDIPMDEVMIYIQNIPLEKDKEMEIQLITMQNIKQEASLFKEMKINLSIKEIMDNYEIVIEKIIEYFTSKKSILTILDYELFRDESLQLLKETERISNRIYNIESSNYAILIYFSIILQESSYIDKVAHFLEDKQLQDYFTINQQTIQNIVLYMFKWKFNKSAKYIENQEYIRKLLDILSEENQCRKVLETQLNLGLLLSTPEDPFEYPLSKQSHCPHINDIQHVFRYQKREYLLNLDLNKLYNLLHSLEKQVYGGVSPQSNQISLHKLYQVMIVELLQKQLYLEVINYISRILQIQHPLKDIGIVYVALYIFKVANQFNEESRKCILKLLALYFNSPLQILKIIDFVIKAGLTGLQQTKHLKELMQRQLLLKRNYSIKNPMFSKEFLQHNDSLKNVKLIESYREFFKSKRVQFQRDNEYDIIFTFMCQSPYLVAKFIQLEKAHLNLKAVKVFLETVINRSVFHPKKSFEVMKRVFTALVVSRKQLKDINQLLISLQQKNIEEEFSIPKLSKLSVYETKLYSIANNYLKNIKSYTKNDNKEAIEEKRILKIKAVLSDPENIRQDKFQVQDLEKQKQKSVIKQPTKEKCRPKKDKAVFNPIWEKRSLFKRTVPFMLFLTSKQQFMSEEKKIELIRKVSAPPVVVISTAKKDSNYLNTKNEMIQRLYSHKVVVGSQCQDDPHERKEDEQFLDSFWNVNELNVSQSSKASRGSRVSIKCSNILQIQLKKQGQILADIDSPKTEKIVQSDKFINIQNQEVNSQEYKYQYLKQNLLKTYHETRIPRFDLSALEKQLRQMEQQNTSGDDQKAALVQKEKFFNKFIKYLYHQPPQLMNITLKLIEQMARKHPESAVNIFFLQAYERTYVTHEKNGLDMDISLLLPVTGIFIKSKDIVDLYKQIQSSIVSKINDENIFKLSKLIALGFRKSIVEQEILFHYLQNLMERFIANSQDELATLRQKIKPILQKLQIQILVDKGEDLFKGLQPGLRRTSLLELYMQSLKNKGYHSAARELASKVQ